MLQKGFWFLKKIYSQSSQARAFQVEHGILQYSQLEKDMEFFKMLRVGILCMRRSTCPSTILENQFSPYFQVCFCINPLKIITRPPKVFKIFPWYALNPIIFLTWPPNFDIIRQQYCHFLAISSFPWMLFPLQGSILHLQLFLTSIFFTFISTCDLHMASSCPWRFFTRTINLVGYYENVWKIGYLL